MLDLSKDIFEVYELMVGPIPKGKGITQNVLCFHHIDTSPSLKLDAQKNIARCFSCRKSWTGQQMEAYLTGKQEESVRTSNLPAKIADAFEDQILITMKRKGLDPRRFVPFFKALDVARYTQGITYEKVSVLWAIFRDKVEEVECTAIEK